ncbi:hypothetical protein TorRG33x02_065500 [Trema orientale]|uniref:Uncharacterized protein n=1 Tax=Trema orientale TaxID=63057 RepID=A0A2P5FIM6_TREOI|nr:hypothetical protein TorRG33x02_065500 [Trema orientale]
MGTLIVDWLSLPRSDYKNIYSSLAVLLQGPIYTVFSLVAELDSPRRLYQSHTRFSFQSSPKRSLIEQRA